MNHWVSMMRIYFWSALTNRMWFSFFGFSVDKRLVLLKLLPIKQLKTTPIPLQSLRPLKTWKFSWTNMLFDALRSGLNKFNLEQGQNTIKESYHMHLQPYLGMLPTGNSADNPIKYRKWNSGSWGFTLQCAEAGLHNKPIVSGPKM